jgi:hypothetical protein
LRLFFTRATPPFTKVLLIESGARRLFDDLIAGLYETYGEQLEIDLLTCYAGVPQGFRGKVFRVTDYRGAAARRQLYAELAAENYPIAGIICSGEPIMFKWKWALAGRLRSKIFVLNENGDYFWIDWSHLNVMVHFALYRAGLTGAAAIPTITRLVFFPLTVSYLLLYAGFVHLRRKLRTL